MNSTLAQIEADILEERKLQQLQIQKQWDRPLAERVESGRALGRLTIDKIDYTNNLIHFIPPREDFAFLRENQPIRLSQNSPDGHYFKAVFLGLTDHGLSVKCSRCNDLDFEESSGWVIDEEFVDLSDFYLSALKSLAEETHGREHVFPVLFEEQAATIDAETYDDTYDSLDESDSQLNESQKDAVATALAASPMHLIQGPPGTGKTQTLANLVDQLVIQGHRILVTGFTHRAIHQALSKIKTAIGDDCPVVKIGNANTSEELPFPCYESLAESELDCHNGPYVIGATPFALFSNRLKVAHFDSAVIDETSQLTLPAAIMVMMKSDRWFFFGDDKQLPPITLLYKNDPAAASIFARLKQQTQFTTLSTTYRMNQQLTRWPSEMFYHGELDSFFPDNKLHLKSSPHAYEEILSPEHSLISVKLPYDDTKSYNDDEADLTAALIEEILCCGISPQQIGVVTPFRAQASRIRTLLRNVIAPPHKDLHLSVIVDTVDRFQGQEREIILYSFTASDPDFLGKIGHFFFNQARLNVAVTRAKTKVILLYSQGLLDFAQSSGNSTESTELFLSLLQQAHPVNITTNGKTFS